MVWREHGFGKFWTFQNLLLHAPVPRAIATFAARDVDDNFTRCLAGLVVQMHGPSLQLERTVDGV